MEREMNSANCPTDWVPVSAFAYCLLPSPFVPWQLAHFF